ncbi:hypothetical protein [Flavobacterium sp. NKUCC04_CG]|uniref:hypothetical protein n=1 Tax=Flavobacterium sp. NKUCC04_CG TaxID=2842121 RepID=UPI002107FE96|nr:hypothetical protein [Flavobacterium sp. NKUCC04_CG]
MKNSMKAIFKVLGVLLVTVFVMAACSKDDDPADNDLFVGTYKGHISYVTDGENIDKADGNVRVVKVGNNYNFIFSDNIPDITGVEFEKKGDNSVISVGSNDTHYIKIDDSKLLIAYAKDGKLWTANANR